MSEKIRTDHLERTAYVYVRQSSLQQVRHHREGQQRQYGLADRARQVGFTRVVVIDDDLGVSDTGRQTRPGFGRLLTAVCEGTVGAVFALEASRLARNNRDWHHLIDLCGMTDTVLVDDDGIYDPRLINDRLLLGLKGTMSEFELSLFRQRAREAFEQKVRRGCVMWEVRAASSAPPTTAWRSQRIVKFRPRFRACFRSFANWAVPAKPCCIFGTNRSGSRKSSAGRRGRRSSGGCPAPAAFDKSCAIPSMPARSPTVIQNLIADGVLPATQVVKCAPWVIERADLQRPSVQARIQAVHDGRKLPRTIPGQDALPLK